MSEGEVIHKPVHPLTLKSQSSAEVHPPSTFPEEFVVLAAILNISPLTTSLWFTFSFSHFRVLFHGMWSINEKRRRFDRWSFFTLAQVNEIITVLQRFFCTDIWQILFHECSHGGNGPYLDFSGSTVFSQASVSPWQACPNLFPLGDQNWNLIVH